MSELLNHDHWQGFIDDAIRRHGVVGLTFGVAKMRADGGSDAVYAASGLANKRTEVPMTTDTLVQIGSNTKVWTATLAMQLVDEGKLDIDAPVTDVLPDFRLSDAAATAGLTPRHLLTHTGGFDGEFSPEVGEADDVLEKFAAALSGATQNAAIGEIWSYCNAGPSLMGRIIEVLRGKTWDQAIQDHIATPLGLTRTATRIEQAILHRVAVGHLPTGTDGHIDVTPMWDIPRLSGPSGGVKTTIEDLFAFGATHLRDGVAADGTRVLSAASAQAMREIQVDLRVSPRTLASAWGLAWTLDYWGDTLVVSHGGGTFGQSTLFHSIPELGLMIGASANGGENVMDLIAEIEDEFARLAGLKGPARLSVPAVAPEVDLDEYLGEYEMAGLRTRVFVENGELLTGTVATSEVTKTVMGTHEEVARLQPYEKDVFLTSAKGADTLYTAHFVTTATGRKYLHWAGRAIPQVASYLHMGGRVNPLIGA